jgi:hypothetical protein
VDFTAANVAETGAPAGSPIGGRLIVTGSAALGGSLVLDVTGTPIVGASFEFLEYGSRTGSFNKVTAEGLDGVAFAVTYGPTGATLAVVNDCNRNGVDDLVDISSASSIDCNGNDVPDECDIRECPPGTVACDDCNLNFLPDSCDIASGASPDVEPADGVPDECRKPVVGGDWGSDIWDLGGPNPYPDDVVGVSGLHITLDAVSVFLDVDAEVPTTRVLGGATLSMGQSGDAGDLTLADPGGVLLRGGTVEIAEGRTLDIAGGRFEIGLGGVYRAVTGMVAGSPGDPCAGRPRAVSISSSLLLNAFGPGGNEGGQLLLSGCMEHDCSGDAVLDGTNATLPCGGASVAGGRTPPTLRISDHALLHVGDLLAMTGPVDFTHNSSDNMQLGGDFDNRSTTPECFDFAGGGMTLDGASDQTFEVAGRELGSTPDGFGGGADSNFSLDRLQIGSDDAGAAVAFVNEQTNTVGSGPCREALYVRELTLKAGSTVSVRDARVYYQTLIEEPGVTVHRFGCGDLIDMSCPLVDAPAIEPLAQIKNRYISFVPGAAGTQSALAFTLAEVHGFESFNGEVRWVGEPETFTDEGLGTFTAAPLRCDPFVTDWGRVGIVSVYGDAIVPESVYEIESIPSGQIASSGGSGPQPTGIGACPQGLRVYTGAWGDVVEPFAGSGPSQPDFSDIASLVDKFTASPAAPSKTRAQLQPNVVRPDSPIDFSDIAATIDAFTGTGYPYAGPSACP